MCAIMIMIFVLKKVLQENFSLVIKCIGVNMNKQP